MMILYNGPSHGYAVMETLRDRLGREISPAIVYPFLSGLLKVGYVRSRREKEGGRVKVVYSLTPNGRRFSDKVFSRLSTIVSTAVAPNQSVCANCGCKLLEAGHMEEIDGKRMVFCCVHCAAAYQRV